MRGPTVMFQVNNAVGVVHGQDTDFVIEQCLADRSGVSRRRWRRCRWRCVGHCESTEMWKVSHHLPMLGQWGITLKKGFLISVTSGVVCFEKLELAGAPWPSRVGLTLDRIPRLTFLVLPVLSNAQNISCRAQLADRVALGTLITAGSWLQWLQ